MAAFLARKLIPKVIVSLLLNYMDVETFYDGILAAIVVSEGGALIDLLAETEEDIVESQAKAKFVKSGSGNGSGSSPPEVAATPPVTSSPSPSPPVKAFSDGPKKITATPQAKKLLKQHKIDISSVNGIGPPQFLNNNVDEFNTTKEADQRGSRRHHMEKKDLPTSIDFNYAFVSLRRLRFSHLQDSYHQQSLTTPGLWMSLSPMDVHRVYMLREAFLLLDFEDDSIEDLKLLFNRSMISPLFLKTEDWRKFLSFLFGLSDQLRKELLAMIRSQILFGRKSMLEAYGDILFRAWKTAPEDSRSEIENGFLQDLVEGTIHASSRSFASYIRRVLGGFINQRTVDGVEKLLYRLAEPVIFRSLQTVCLYDASANVLRGEFLHGGPVLDCCFHDDSSGFSASSDNTVRRLVFGTWKKDILGKHDAHVRCGEDCCGLLMMVGIMKMRKEW